jgi:hypothetical protein
MIIHHQERVIPSAPPLIRLLEAASQDRTDLTLASLPPGQIRWAVETGLGPWLRRCTANDPDAAASPLWPLVHSADLTARVIAGEQLDAMDEVARVCEDHATPVTLLKGISICEQYYPEPHLRVMRDIDLLIDEDRIPAIESRLLELGYVRMSENPPAFYETHHHTAPFFHPHRRVWLELHRQLLPSNCLGGWAGMFGLEAIRSQLRPSFFRGRPVNRLSDELQLLYLAVHWAFGLQRVGGMVGMLDVSRILNSAPHLEWERILGWLDGSSAVSTYLCLLLTYLDGRHLANIEPGILREVYSRQRSFGAMNLAALHAVIDRYVVDGRESRFLMSARNFSIVWQNLLGPRRPSLNALMLLWRLLPSRAWFFSLRRPR